MKWVPIIRDLLESGLTQTQIAERVGSSQSTISEILNSDRRPNKKGERRVSYDLGSRLAALHAERCKQEA